MWKIPLCIIFIILSGCSASNQKNMDKSPNVADEIYHVDHQKVDSLTDPFTVDTIYFYNKNIFKVGIERYKHKSSESCMIVITYFGRSWLFMDGNVVIKIDGEISTFKDKKPSRMVLGNTVREDVHILVSGDMIKKMRNAKEIGIQFMGPPIYVDDSGKRNIGIFYDEYIAGTKQMVKQE